MEGRSALTGKLRAHVELNRLMGSCLDEAMEGLGLTVESELKHEAYELGVSVGAAEVLRFVLPRLSEHVPEHSPLRDLVQELRLCYGELTGEGVSA